MGAKKCKKATREERESYKKLSHLDEADVLGIVAEALTADVEVVLADDTLLVGAHAAARRERDKGESVRFTCVCEEKEP